MRAGEEFFNFHNHDMVRVAVAIPAVRVANPAFNGDQTVALMRQAAERHAAIVLFPELGLPGYSCEDLHQQRVVLDGCLAALRADCRGQPRARYRRGRRPRDRESTISFSTAPPSSIADASSAWCPRPICPTTASSTRCASSCPATWRCATKSSFAANPRFRSAPPAVRGRGTAAAHVSRRDLRGPVGADSAVVVRGARRRDGAAESFGLAGHGRQGRISPRAGRKPVGPMHGGLSIRRRRRRRIDHRPRVGRPGSDLRKRQSARRVAALQPRAATHLLGDRSRTPLAGADAPDQLRADGASSSRRAAAISHRSNSRAELARRGRMLPSAGPSASPTCRRTRRGATSDARRCTKSRCKGWRRGCARRESSAS